jgi:7,8-dihydropterin-6-yl-methyl-4-(beta-D-ribofuranosyl)aminobenzene 5'-phosphate synthase
VKALKITVLSTMLTDRAGVGDWGFGALVEVDGRRFLFDTGGRPETVLTNVKELGLDLSDVTDVVISHNHGDHTLGLVPLRKELQKKNPAALSRAHVAPGALWSRPSKDGERNELLLARAGYEGSGAKFVEHTQPFELAPGVWLTGPVPRIHPERNWSFLDKVQTPEGLVEDIVQEDQSMIFDTDAGLVLLSGCGHAGVINTAEYARKVVREAPLYAAVGGFHLFPADDARLGWTIEHLRGLGLQQLLGAHCTGLDPVYRIRAEAKLDPKRCLVGAVGSSFTLDGGIHSGLLH